MASGNLAESLAPAVTATSPAANADPTGQKAATPTESMPNFDARLDAAEAAAASEETETEKRRVKRTPLADFKRDTEQTNTLIQGGWGKRGGISMHVSTTGSGKSVLQTQATLCFNCGVPCCGLTPTRPFTTWVIQSEDDDDRVAFDRDGIVAHLADLHPDKDWNAATEAVQFLDFTGITGADFIETLDGELSDGTPDAVIVNPLNAFFGGNLKDGADASAFFKGGEIRRKETEGLEAVLKRHKVWGWLFAHTPKPPTTKELDGWLNDAFPEYKCCGASEIADAVRSVITFLKVPGRDGVFSFTAGKNGKGLGWTDANGNPTNRAFFRWAQTGGHFWEAVPEAERPTISNASGTKPPKPPPPPRDETPVVIRVFKTFTDVVDRGTAEMAVRNAVNAERRASVPVVKDLGEKQCRDLLNLMAARGVIEILPKGTRGAKGCMCGLPAMVRAFLNPPLIDVPTDDKAITPGAADAHEPPTFGRSRKMGSGEKEIKA